MAVSSTFPLPDLGFSGHSLVGWLFTDEEQKKVGSLPNILVPHIQALCMTSQTQTVGHKMAALTSASMTLKC